jgi:Glycosyltransferase family 87
MEHPIKTHRLRSEMSQVCGELRSADTVATVLWCLAVLIGVIDLYQYHHLPVFGVDFASAWGAAHALLHHHTKWGGFVYLPGCLIFVFPLAAIPLRMARLVIYAVQFAGLGYSFWAITRITHRSLGSRSVAGLACVLVVAGQIGVVSYYENFTLLLVPLAAAFYLAIDRGHSVWAAVVLGISITIKPLLLPLFVVFVLHRKWRSTAVAVLIPFVLTCIAFVIVAFSGSPSQFFHEVFAIFGSDARFPINMSISGMGSILSLPTWLVVIFRVAAGLICVGMCRRMWLRPIGGPGEQAIWLTAPLLIGMILCFTFAWAYYAVLFVPLVLVTLDRRDLGGRLIQFGVVLALLFPLLIAFTSGYPSAHPSDIIAFLGLVLVMVGIALIDLAHSKDSLARRLSLDLTGSR